MSVEEEVELRDLVSQVLESNGCLPKMRAQIRANVFLALDEDSKISKQQPLLNPKLKTYLESPEGQMMFCLVREFLEYFDLDFTASVYDPESYLGNFYKYEGRQKVIEDLGLKPPQEDFSGPVLLQVMKIAQTKSKTLKIDLTVDQKESMSDQINGHSEQENVKENGFGATFVKNDDDTFNGTSSIEEETVNGDEEQETSQRSGSKSNKSDKLKKLELPPLQLNKARGSDLLPSLYKKSKEYDFEIKDDYEEDFMSGSELEFSQSKMDSPRPLLEELQQCSEHTSNLSLNKLNSDNKVVNSNSTDNIETNLSVDENTSQTDT